MISNLETFKLNCKWISEINQAPLPRNLHSEKKKRVPHNQIVNSCIQHSDHKKNNKDFLHPTALLRLIPTVSCHDATAPVKDKVAIILLPVSSPLWFWTCDSLSQKEPASVWEFLCYTCPGEETHTGRRSHTVKHKPLTGYSAYSWAVPCDFKQPISHRIFELHICAD